MSVVVAPYGIRFEEDGRIGTFPAVLVSFQKNRQGEDLQSILLIDSGATVSTLPASDAAALGYVLDEGERTLIRGFGSALEGFRHTLTCTVGNTVLQVPVVFVDYPGVPRILGRAGIFNQFTIVFEERKNRTGFLEHTSKQAAAVSKMLA